MLLSEFTRRISLAEVTHWARSDTAALRTISKTGAGWMSQRFLRYTISPWVLIPPAGRYPTGYYAAGGSEQCGLYGENASIAFLIRNPRGRAVARGGGGYYHHQHSGDGGEVRYPRKR